MACLPEFYLQNSRQKMRKLTSLSYPLASECTLTQTTQIFFKDSFLCASELCMLSHTDHHAFPNMMDSPLKMSQNKPSFHLKKRGCCNCRCFRVDMVVDGWLWQSVDKTLAAKNKKGRAGLDAIIGWTGERKRQRSLPDFIPQ